MIETSTFDQQPTRMECDDYANGTTESTAQRALMRERRKARHHGMVVLPLDETDNAESLDRFLRERVANGTLDCIPKAALVDLILRGGPPGVHLRR
jgi:hypothetical protein